MRNSPSRRLTYKGTGEHRYRSEDGHDFDGDVNKEFNALPQDPDSLPVRERPIGAIAKTLDALILAGERARAIKDARDGTDGLSKIIADLKQHINTVETAVEDSVNARTTTPSQLTRQSTL